MTPLRIILQLCACDDPAQILEALATALEDTVTIRCALRVSAADSAILQAIPPEAAVSPELIATAAKALRPEILPLGSQFPQESVDYPDSEVLLLPLKGGDAETLVLLFEQGALGEDIAVWEELAGGIQRIRERAGRLVAAERERQELRRRAEESEALHTLGLAANRTLDQDEVLALVARFTRTLLGAHFATVHTREGEDTHLVASVGLRRGEADDAGENALARRVIEAEKPVIVGGSAGIPIRESPLDPSHGTRAALGIPLALYGDTFGALVVGYRRAYDVTPADIRLAMTLAGHAAVAISNAHLHRKLKEHATQLDEAYRQLNEATLAKERFFNAISHDLRTPIGAIVGYSELILEGVGGELHPQIERYVRSSHRAAETLLALVNDILDFAKLESGKLELNMAEWQLGELVEDALAAVRPQAAAKGLRLAAPDPTLLPPVRTDGKRLRQILVNLLSNAVKFTDQGSVSVEVSSSGNPEPRLTVSVIDTGRGIPPEEQARVFEEFEQVHGSEGTGLGLPISRKLAQLLGGDLELESAPGQGSTFRLTLPAQRAAGREARATGPRGTDRSRDAHHAVNN